MGATYPEMDTFKIKTKLFISIMSSTFDHYNDGLIFF